jgi:3-oxoadipate enol-lactonase
VRLDHRLDGPDDAPVLVLSPSLGTRATLWDAQLPRLAGTYRVLRHEHPGHTSVTGPGTGLAPAPTAVSVADIAEGVVELLDELGVERASFCGVSLGGMVGMWLAVHAPERIDRLVLASTGARLGSPETYLERATLVRNEGTRPLVDGARERWFTAAFRDAPAAQRILDELAAVPRDGYAACCEAVGRFDLRAELHRITAPTLVVHGDQDVVITPDIVDTLATRIAGAVVHELRPAAHLANVERADEFTDALLVHVTTQAAA